MIEFSLSLTVIAIETIIGVLIGWALACDSTLRLSKWFRVALSITAVTLISQAALTVAALGGHHAVGFGWADSMKSLGISLLVLALAVGLLTGRYALIERTSRTSRPSDRRPIV